MSKKLGISQVDHIVAVSSAKGGVGKSTTSGKHVRSISSPCPMHDLPAFICLHSVNIAIALATSLSLRVGLLDADIHGPSIGKMMNLRGKPEISETGESLISLNALKIRLGGDPCPNHYV